jgi:Family of unknown function (DUF6261)
MTHSNLDLSNVLSLYKFPTERRLMALERVLEAARQRGLQALVQRVEAALQHDQATRLLEYARRPHEGQHGPGAMALDKDLDHALSAFDDVLAAQAKLLGEDSAEATAAAALREALFPRGVGAVTQGSYVQQHQTLNVLLPRLEAGGDLRAQVERLELQRTVARLVAQNERYGAALNASDELPTRKQVREARAVGQRNLLAVVAMILGTYPEATPEHEAGLEALFQPIADQNRAIRQRRRGRRPLTDDSDEPAEVTSESPAEDEDTMPPEEASHPGEAA